MVCGGAASAPSEEGAGAPKGFRGATEGEITRACCLLRGADEHGAKKRSFAFSLVYIKCFRTYSLYLSFRHGVLILYRRATLPPRRSPLVLRLFALALADGSGLPFSLHPPPAALESQLCKGSWIFAPFGRKKTEGLYPRPVTAFTPNFDSKSKSVRGAGAPSPRLCRAKAT